MVIASVLYGKQDVCHDLAGGPPHERSEHDPRVGHRVAELTEPDAAEGRDFLQLVGDSPGKGSLTPNFSLNFIERSIREIRFC